MPAARTDYTDHTCCPDPASQDPAPSPTPEPAPARAGGSAPAPVNNTAPERRLLKNPRRAAAGAALGAAVGALAGAAIGWWLGDGSWTGCWAGMAIGGLLAACLGALLGNHREAIEYDAQAAGKWVRNVGSTVKGMTAARVGRTSRQLRRAIHRAAGSPLHPMAPLTVRDLCLAVPTGNVARQYDGYDSSRDIFAVYAREGDQAAPYTFQVELAHYRPGAEHGHLRVVLLLSWAGEAGTPQRLAASRELPPPLAGPPLSAGWKLAMVVERCDQIRVLDSAGTTLADDCVPDACFDPAYNHLELQLDKRLLRERGWRDGQPLELAALTSSKDDPRVVAQVSCRTAAAAPSTDSAPDPEALLRDAFRWEGKVIYFALTDRFHRGNQLQHPGTDRSNPERFHGGDWQGIIDKLDYLEGLGIDCVWISCPYLNDTDFFGKDGFHGYWPRDFFAPDPHFGDLAKLKELSQKCHQRGLRLMLDVVVNHTGYNHPLVTDPSRAGWFHREGNIKWLGQHHMENAALAGLPDLDQNNPEVARHLIDAHRMWLSEAEVDAFRMDAVRHVPETFLRQFDQEMHRLRPGYLSIGECFWVEPNFIAGYQNRAVDSMFDFPLAYAIRDVFACDRTRRLGDRLRMATRFFMDNPNEAVRELLSPNGGSMLRLSAILALDGLYDNPRRLATLVDNHDMIRFMSDTGGDLAQLELALAFLFACRGIPAIYYGTEVGMAGGAGENRNDMEWGRNPALTDRVRQLVRARRSSLALQLGSQQDLRVTTHSYAFARLRPEEEVVCVFNNSAAERELRVPLYRDTRIPEGAELRDLLSEVRVPARQRRVTVTLAARGACYLQWRDRLAPPL